MSDSKNVVEETDRLFDWFEKNGLSEANLNFITKSNNELKLRMAKQSVMASIDSFPDMVDKFIAFQEAFADKTAGTTKTVWNRRRSRQEVIRNNFFGKLGEVAHGTYLKQTYGDAIKSINDIADFSVYKDDNQNFVKNDGGLDNKFDNSQVKTSVYDHLGKVSAYSFKAYLKSHPDFVFVDYLNGTMTENIPFETFKKLAQLKVDRWGHENYELDLTSPVVKNYSIKNGTLDPINYDADKRIQKSGQSLTPFVLRKLGKIRIEKSLESLKNSLPERFKVTKKHTKTLATE